MQPAIHITLPVANRIFHSASQATTSQRLLGVFHMDGEQSEFLPARDEAMTFDENRLPVYLHQPPDDISGRYLLVETGTKGVLEISACLQHHGKRETIPVLT